MKTKTNLQIHVILKILVKLHNNFSATQSFSVKHNNFFNSLESDMHVDDWTRVHKSLIVLLKSRTLVENINIVPTTCSQSVSLSAIDCIAL